ncbi:MAG: STAS domain-containing protein [Burkholderiaceae bacterium]|nr:STAS domain-containing protein [Burkholderiaceae bacterium]
MLVLPDRLTHEQAPACSAMLAATLRAQPAGDVCVDASALQHFDSSALAVLLACRREALAAGRRFAVQGMPLRLQSLAGLYGVASLLDGALHKV